MTDPEVHDHYRPPSDHADVEDGVYRVVGVEGDAVTLLRVTDAEGRRRNTGEVVSVDADRLSEYSRADDPDAGFSPLRTVREGFEGVWILLRGLVRR